jgi:spermidine synthase
MASGRYPQQAVLLICHRTPGRRCDLDLRFFSQGSKITLSAHRLRIVLRKAAVPRLDDSPTGQDERVEEPVVVGRSTTSRGEVLLRRRGPIEELLVNGTFAMDSTETHSERELGRLAGGAPRVLVGGLGLGCTAAAVLDEADQRGCAVSVDVVELEPALGTWAREGRTATLARVAADPRVRLHVADVANVLAGLGDVPVGPWDAILLDVDNGPDFLIHAQNDALYAEPGLRSAYARLAPAGVLAVWCQAPSRPLLDALRRVDPSAEETRHAVQRDGRTFVYAIDTVRRPLA